MINYEVINTGSDGNCVILEKSIAIDMGVAFKKLKNIYKNLSIIFLTHIHGDHFNKATIRKLSKLKPTLRFGCCEWLVNDLVECGVNKKNIDVLEIGKTYDYDIFKVMPVKAYHDVPNCGYRIFINNMKILYITDTEHLKGIEARDYDLYLIEANYIEKELEERIITKQSHGEYVYEDRVKYTHLSKEQCDSFLVENASDKSIYEYLHMHKERGV